MRLGVCGGRTWDIGAEHSVQPEPLYLGYTTGMAGGRRRASDGGRQMGGRHVAATLPPRCKRALRALPRPATCLPSRLTHPIFSPTILQFNAGRCTYHPPALNHTTAC